MRKTTFVSAAVLVCVMLLSVACTSDANKETEATAQAVVAPLTFEIQQFKKQSSTCKSDTVACATVQATYPLALGGVDSVRQAINDTLMHYLKAGMAVFAVEDEEFNIPLDDVAARFIKDYEDLRRDNPAYDIPWEVETTGKVLYQSTKLASIQMGTYSYAGGAHPNSFATLLTFEKSTGKKLELSDFIIDRDRLTFIAEQHFRKTNEIAPKTSLDDAGFFWGEAFSLPENFALLEKGLYCFYNTYEVAPYVLGPTEFTIPYEELVGILNKNRIFEVKN